ncbi:unnamed protein product [Ceutorhynchus assimilis]|uniref:Peptidase metallopeptidase domain-containing protein n=1 Tax=Ceutorhynchus assimilis TaxID=467358 RepID=A0A9N9QNP8_9CUCU|nr:unnamed protein product [Ceutorhynchus assimilis]
MFEKTNKSDKVLKKKLILKRKIIREKLNLLKQGQILQENLFQPITKHLTNIETQLDKNQNLAQQQQEKTTIAIPTTKKLKKEQDEEDNYDYEEDDVFKKVNSELYEPTPRSLVAAAADDTPRVGKTTKIKRKLPFTQISDKKTKKSDQPQHSYNLRRLLLRDNVEKYATDEEEARKQKDFNESRQNEFLNLSQTEYLDQFDPLPAKYIQEFINDPATDPALEGNVLPKYRIRRDEIDNFYIGDSKVEIVGSDLIVKGRRYKGTPGLYKLLFRKNMPKSYTKDDEAAFKDIISRTNINRKRFKTTGDENDSQSEKFKLLFEPLTTTGNGMVASSAEMKYSNNSIDYIYWDDPNELVERLQLLLASQTAGNTNHNNEINAIVEDEIRGAWARETIEGDFKKNLKLLDNSNELMKEFFGSTETVNFKTIGSMDTHDFISGLREGEAARTLSKANPAMASMAVETNRYIQAMNREALEMPDKHLKNIAASGEEIRSSLPDLDLKTNSAELETEIAKDSKTKEKVDKIEERKTKTGKYALFAIGSIFIGGTIYSALNAIAEIRSGCIYYKTHNQTTVGCKIIKCSCSFPTVGSGMGACTTLPTNFPLSDCTCTSNSPQCLKCTASKENSQGKENYDPTILHANEVIKCVSKSISETIADLYNQLPRSIIGSLANLGNIVKYVIYTFIRFGCCYLLFKLWRSKSKATSRSEYSNYAAIGDNGHSMHSMDSMDSMDAAVDSNGTGYRRARYGLGTAATRFQETVNQLETRLMDRLSKDREQTLDRINTGLNQIKNVLETQIVRPLKDHGTQIQKTDGSKLEEKDLIDFLSYHGYLNISQNNNVSDLVTPEKALKEFQIAYNLKADGTLNGETASLIERFWCGTRDNNYQIGNVDEGKWKYKIIKWIIHPPTSHLRIKQKYIKVAENAFNLWENETNLKFVYSNVNPNIIISFNYSNHSLYANKNECPYEFHYYVLAHSYFPSLQSETVEIHMNRAFTWYLEDAPSVPDSQKSLLQVLTHEIGHALGIGHSHDTQSIMYPALLDIGPDVRLSSDDKEAIQELYGKKQ